MGEKGKERQREGRGVHRRGWVARKGRGGKRDESRGEEGGAESPKKKRRELERKGEEGGSGRDPCKRMERKRRGGGDQEVAETWGRIEVNKQNNKRRNEAQIRRRMQRRKGGETDGGQGRVLVRGNAWERQPETGGGRKEWGVEE